MQDVTIISLNGKTPRIDPSAYVAPGCRIIGDVEIGAEASIWYNCVLRGDVNAIRIGARSNVQDGCVLHTDPGYPLVIGPDCTVGHMVMLHGCSIGRASLIGIGSIILNGAKIGEECVIGANTLIPEGKVIPPRSMVLGSPGKVVRELSGEEAARFSAGAARYVANWKRYASGLKPLA